MFGERESEVWPKAVEQKLALNWKGEGHEPGFTDNGFLKKIGLLKWVSLENSKTKPERKTHSLPQTESFHFSLFIYMCKQKEGSRPFSPMSYNRGKRRGFFYNNILPTLSLIWPPVFQRWFCKHAVQHSLVFILEKRNGYIEATIPYFAVTVGSWDMVVHFSVHPNWTPQTTNYLYFYDEVEVI